MPLTREHMLAEMDRALAEEIAAQNSSRNSRHSATDGKLISDENGQHIYTFVLDEIWDTQDDTPLRIENVSGQETKCFVVNARGTLITIAADKLLPEDLLQRIDFIDDSTELLKRQRVALKQAQEGEGRLASKSFDLIPYRAEALPLEYRFSTRTILRERQYRAASKALGGEVAFIVGPPGTGKTLTLAAIAFSHLREGRTVLIAAHTNIAVDNAIMKLCELCKEAGRDDLLAQSQVVRFGAVQKEELKTDAYQEVYLPKIVQHLNVQVQQKYDECKKERDELKKRIEAILQQRQTEIQKYQQSLEQSHIRIGQIRDNLQPLEEQERKRQITLRKQQERYRDELQQLERIWIETSQLLAQTKAFIIEQSNAYTRSNQQEQDLLQRLLEARAMNGMQRFLHRVSLEKLEQQVGEVSYQTNQFLVSAQAAHRDGTRFQSEMNKQSQRRQYCQNAFEELDQQLSLPSPQTADIMRLQAELTQIQQRYQQEESLLNRTKQLQQPELQTLNVQLQPLESRLAALDQQKRDIEKKIVENAFVVGTTLTKTYMNQTINNRRFDAVILDEVSMASMPLIYIAAAHADHSVTFIGDPEQLAPIVTKETDTTKKWLKTDLFNFRKISLEAANKEYNHSTLLNVQSRMHPQIARIANELIYQSRLQDDFDESQLKRISPLPDAPLVLCNTQDAAPTVSRPPNGRSRRNYYHALCCLELAKKALQQLPATSKLTTPVIGIITPYAPQARLIQSLIKKAEPELQNAVQVGTIHRFQGLEFDIVIFDTVESPGLAPGEFISGSTGSDTMRMINVAITRARYKLVIVAHQHHILHEFPEMATMKRVVQSVVQSAICSSLDVVGTSLVMALQQARIQGLSPEKLFRHVLMNEEILVLHPAEKAENEEISLYNEKTFYEACKQDLSMAHESIIIASPFLASARVEKILPLLLKKQQQGIKITIYTRPLKDSEDWHIKAAHLLLDAGLSLIDRPKMHQKAVIVDEKVLYHGSLNILSQRDTSESMLRIIKVPQLIATLSEELQMPIPSPSNTRKMTEEEIQKLKTISISQSLLPELEAKCACGSHFVPRLRKDGNGAFYGCKNYQSCSHKNTVNITKDHLLQVPILQNRTCTQCHSSLALQFQYKPQLIFFSCENQCEEKHRIIFTS